MAQKLRSTKSRSPILPFNKKIDDQSDIWVEHLSTILAGGGGNMNDVIFKVQMPRGLLKGCISFELIDL